MKALWAATALPARRFSLDDRGRIAPGMRADLVLVAGDPTVDILATRDIQHVIKEGQFVDLAAYRAEAIKSRETVVGGLVSDFEQPEVRAAFGSGWGVVTDALFRGDSTVEIGLVDGGAKRTPLPSTSRVKWWGIPPAGTSLG
jgi:Amidohydrolase family